MSNALLEVLITLPPQVAIAWGFTRVLPMRCAPLFVVANAAVVTALNAIGERFVDVWAGLVLLLAVCFVLPFALYRGSPLLRAVVVVAGNVCDSLVHGLAFAVWAALMEAPVPDDIGPYYDAVRANPASFAVSEVVSIVAAVGMFVLLAAVVRRFRGGEAFVHGWISFSFLLSQVVMMVELLMVEAHFEVSAEMATATCLLLVGCLVVDWLLLTGMGRYERLLLDRERGDVLERQLEASLASYSQVVDEMERTGRIRHDLLNHMQVVEALVAEGQVERARSHVAALRGALAEGKREAGDIR
ncbi:Spo0B domain-containing protein [Arabiibacter massiliensis]|uniref:Spo0B domain-containing protein n=1 Tax=Arabiibacter massiliensis TaxID=1870985 RepID=UPI0009BB690B|nr:hypothetical protein [Arabiibacter massiliensis]